MPTREIPFKNNEIYHIVNRGITDQVVFNNKRAYQRAVDTICYYQNCNLPCRFSQFESLNLNLRQELRKELMKKKELQVEIIAYCLMPNHFHLLLKQSADKGIHKFVKNFTISYSRYFNTKNERKGPMFQGQFKAIRITSDEQLLHVQRYIHLNPYSSFLVKTIDNLLNYEFSSLREYLGISEKKICNKKIVLDYFKNRDAFKNFVLDQADYQRSLDVIKHASLD